MAENKFLSVHPPLLEFRAICKSFPGSATPANKDISFSVREGSIHALIGENGAGKSTLMKILFGLFKADSGEVFLRGKSLQLSSPNDAKAAGLGMVHQHFMLAGPVRALDHILLDQNLGALSLGQKISHWFLPLPRKAVRQEIENLSNNFHMPVAWETPVEKLSVGLQQRVEILKLIYNKAEILILDEPTAVLTPQEIESFFDQLKALKQSGKTILLISHKLKEVLSLADDVSVLRQGQLIHSGPAHDHSIASLGELMVGREIKEVRRTANSIRPHSSQPALHVQGLCYSEKRQSYLHNINIEVNAGEIVGIAGVEANGQSEILDLLLRPRLRKGRVSGTVAFLDNDLLVLSNQQIRKLGVSCFPEDRLGQALLLESSAQENYLLGQQWKANLRCWGFIRRQALQNETLQMMKQNDVRPVDVKRPLRLFSGGNQQKFVVGRELGHQPKMLIAAQPTRGVDVGAIESIHSKILEQRNSGTAVLLVSSELDELTRLSDRIYVLFRGEIVAHLKAEEFDDKKIGASMGGAR
jgi:ABC-type uncharacterized transport system ATPase subunit